jgi:dTDP-4-dehydrorhamnose reductase
VGRAVARLLPHADLRSRQQLDVCDADALERAARGVDVVVHLAAMTNVDGCEADPDRAMAINAEGTHNVVEAARSTGARVIYLSTDYVFDGNKEGEYAEDDFTSPLNAYGRSKLEGEKAVVSYDRGLVVRASWIYGDGHNFIRTILAAARDNDQLSVIHDQQGRPTSAEDLAAAIAHLLEHPLQGIVHFAGMGEACSWAELAEYVLSIVGSDAEVRRIDSQTYAARARKLVAPRPANGVLSLDQAQQLGIPLPRWRDSVRTYVEGLD